MVYSARNWDYSMTKSRLKISETVLKTLFAKSGNICAFPNCTTPIIVDEGDESKPLAEMAHIIAYEDEGPRSDPSVPVSERNKADNLILFCPNHHTIVDKFEHQYNIHVLREMKRIHEERVGQSMKGYQPKKEEILSTETLHSSMLPISRLPQLIFSATTQYRKGNIIELFERINRNKDGDFIYSFELSNGRIYTFTNLRINNNPYDGTYDKSTIEVASAIDFWSRPDTYRLYISLLNRSLTSFLKRRRVAYDRTHHRYYFQPEKNVIERKFSYKSLSGKRTSRSIVHNPVTKATGQPKSYWIHLGANLSFQQLSDRQWVLSIRPERHLTQDGIKPYVHKSIGSKITRIKSTMYNWNYLQELQLWREFICEAKPRRVLSFDKEHIVIENSLLKGEIKWAGILNDEKDFVSQEHAEDLFSLAEIEFLNEDSFDSIYLEDYEE
jgi:hypothetical protein